MLNQYRKNFFTIFATFFVISLPFLLIFSLGYNFDFESNQLESSLTAYIQTVPRRAEIKNQETIYRTPVEIKINNQDFTKIDLELEGYNTEQFVFSATDKNTALRMRNIWMLPTDSSDEFELPQGFEFINFLSKDYLLISKDQDLFIQNFNFGGLQSDPVDLNIDFNESLKDIKFEIISSDYFWDPIQNILIYNDTQLGWQVFDFKVLPFQTTSASFLSSSQIVLLDSEKNLWVLNLKNKVFTFLDSNIDGMSFTGNPDMLWFLKQDSVYRLERRDKEEEINLQNLNILSNLYTKNLRIRSSSENIKEINYKNFIVRNVFLGISFQIQNDLFYVEDSNKNSLKQIIDNAVIVGSASNTLFWLDTELNFRSYNLLSDTFFNFSNLTGDLKENQDVSDFKIYYYSNWNRIMVYGDKKVYSVWFDIFNLNSSIIKYYPVKWIQNKECFNEVIRNYQFCSDGEKLFFYKNDSFTF